MITFRKGHRRVAFLTTFAEGESGYTKKRHRLVTKTWRVMNITAILLLGICLQAAASGNAQRITYNAKNVSVNEVLLEVKKQTGYGFVCDDDAGNATIAAVNVSDLELDEFLKKVLSPKELNYILSGHTIFVRRKDDEKKGPTFQFATPPITVRGKIVNEKGEPVAASVVIKGTKIGVTTDSYGSFELQNVPDNATLVISGISIESQEISVNNKSEINITAMTRIAAEEEVTISTGYISSTKRKSTANIVKVTSADIERQPLTTPLTSLQGRVAGLEVSTTSGNAGVAPKIRIRGENSLVGYGGGGLPLYVIDGVPYDPRQLSSFGSLTGASGFDPLASIPVSTIESIEVLKDGAATGIYGSRGANGVILITTKKGKTEGRKTNLDVSYYAGGGKVAHFMDVLSTSQYLQMRREAKNNDGGMVGDYDFDINGTFDTTRDVNWQKELLGATAKISDFQAFVHGGNVQTNFRIGGTLHNETTVYPGNFGFNNIAGFANINHSTVDQRLRFSLTVNYAANQNKLANSSSYIVAALTLPPDAPELYTENGELNWQRVTVFGNTFSSWRNPLSYLLSVQDVHTDNLLSNFNLEYSIVRGLTFKINSGFNLISSREIASTPIASYSPESLGPFTTGTSVFTTNNRKIWSVEPQLVYTNNWSKHALTAIVGGALQQTDLMAQAVSGDGYRSDALLNSILGAATKTFLVDQDNQYRYVAGFGIIHYDYDGKYLLDVNFRRDGSSRFGPGRQFGNFGGIGVGWLFSNEKLFDHSSFLSYGKIRASYAITGNDQIDDYRFYSTYALTGRNYLGIATLRPNGLFNPNLGWESTKKAEIALETGFLNNKILLDVAYYSNRSSNQLVDYSLPLTTGFPAIFKNFDATVQNTGWEAVLTTKNMMRKNFRWTSSFNITFPRNKLIAFPGIENSSYKQRYKVGESLSILNLYHYTGVDPETGAYSFLDVDANGQIDVADKLFTFSVDKRLYGGFTNTFTIKSFTFSFLLQFVRQNGLKPVSGILPGFSGNQPVYVLDRWRKTGDITDVQRYNADFSLSAPYDNMQSSDYIKDDASFMRLKTLSLQWSLPQLWVSKLALTQAKIFIQGQNLVTITGYDGLDPETGASVLPPLRMITAGLQLNF